MDRSVGLRVRHLREASGLSLRDLAERSGVSAPMLSQVERDETSPTLAVARKIARGLDLSLSQLLRFDEDPNVVLVRRRERRRLTRDGHTTQELTPSLPGQPVSVTEHTLAAGATTGGADDPPLHQAGSRETAVVQDGSVTLVIGDQRHPLRTGDAVTFDADVPHRFENTSRRACTLLAVVTAGRTR